eukprot:TRINITY_DN2042_c0_g1_i4.p1 TRINITY_DN2042_c0_g1~~TRINITY_DN2042_c0_g1_i4.p1  ORF type:complete len:167 (-),score=0.16 TRINITY_DN2042_c0_g1_i4:428-877(-)
MWSMLISVSMPVPMVLLALMCLPLPRVYRRYMVDFTKNVFEFQLVQGMKLMHVMLLVTGLAFGNMIRKTAVIYSQPIPMDISPNHKIGLLADKWRAERNFWISFMCFSLWCLLWAFYRLAHAFVRKSEELEIMRSKYENGSSKETKKAN